MARRPRRLIISSDTHKFIGRIYDLSIVGMNFDNYEKAIEYPNVKYVLNVNERTTLLVRRVESLNHLGDLLWPKVPTRIETLPMSAYEFCNFIQDAFLMRAISILDCCCLLAVDVLELDVAPRQANIEKIKKASGNHPCCEKLRAMSKLQLDLRTERNARFHHGEEESLTDDDLTFKTVALFTYRGSGMTGTDRHGRPIDLKRFYNEAIDHLREKFRVNLRSLSISLDKFYDALSDEFDGRSRPKFRGASGFGRVDGVLGK